MFKLSEIKELIKLVDQTSVQELEIENEDSRLSIRKPGQAEAAIVQAAVPAAAPVAVPVQAQISAAPAAQPAAPAAETAAAPVADDLHKITSPMVGTYYSAPSPTSPAFVQKGDKVNPKTIVCIVEAMKL